MPDPTATAATIAVTFVALRAAHMVGDHILQTTAQAMRKGMRPARWPLLPWAGWGHCLRHVATYTATQALALAVLLPITPLTLTGALTALAVSAATHAVIDRRWLVRAIVTRRADGGAGWPEAMYLTDQSLHEAALLGAAVAAALATNWWVALLAVGAGVVLVLTAMLAEAVLCAARPAAVRDHDSSPAQRERTPQR
jgi:hypothetical protein